MAKRNTRRVFSTSSLHDISLNQVIEDFDSYSPEMLNLLPPVQRKELLLFCPVVSICHLEQTCAFDGIDSETFWKDLVNKHKGPLASAPKYDVNAYHALDASYSSNREKYFTFLTAVIFSGDRFSGHYAFFSAASSRQDFYEGCSPPPGERDAPIDPVNFLVAYHRPYVAVNEEIIEEIIHEEPASCKDTSSDEEEEEEDEEEEDRSDNEEFYYPLASRDVFHMLRTKNYKHATEGQHVHSRYSHYIMEKNYGHLSDEDAMSLMMNECKYYPKKLYIHEYENMQREWSHGDFTRLLNQFLSKLESLDLYFRVGKDLDCYTNHSDYGFQEVTLEEILTCCFNSPSLYSVTIGGPVEGDRASLIVYSTLVSRPSPSLKMLSCDIYGNASQYIETIASVISCHSQLSEIHLDIGNMNAVGVNTFAQLFTSLTGFVEKPEFSILTLEANYCTDMPVSSQLQHLLDVFLTTPCSHPQQIHLGAYCLTSFTNEASPIHISTGDNKVPSGALEYKSLTITGDPYHSKVPQEFCDWLFSHQPLVLKAFHFNVPSMLALPMHILSDSASFQTQELSLPWLFGSDSFNQHLETTLHRQQLTKLSLIPDWRSTKPCHIDKISSILSILRERLTDLTVRRKQYECDYYIIGSSKDMERFGDAVYSLSNYEVFSLDISMLWKMEDIKFIDALYNSWLKHGCRKLKSFQMGRFDYGLALPDELARKIDKMGLAIIVPPRF